MLRCRIGHIQVSFADEQIIGPSLPRRYWLGMVRSLNDTSVRFWPKIDSQPFSITLLLAALILLIHPLPASAKIHFRSSHQALASQNRKKLHVNSLITTPGAVEVEFAHAHSVTTRSDYLPTTLKWTPGTSTGLWGRTELSVGFDFFSSVFETEKRTNQFSDHLSFAATSVLYGGAKLNLAVAPVAFFYVRGDQGARLGGVGLARYDTDLNSAGMTLSWTGATASSASNPAGTFDLGGGYGRKLAETGFCSHLTPHANLIYERSSGGIHGLSIFEGLEYQLTEKLAIDSRASTSTSGEIPLTTRLCWE
jgi:hypothetical protein